MVIMQESEFEQNNSYKLLKTEVLRIFGPKIDADSSDEIDRLDTNYVVKKNERTKRAKTFQMFFKRC